MVSYSEAAALFKQYIGIFPKIFAYNVLYLYLHQPTHPPTHFFWQDILWTRRVIFLLENLSEGFFQWKERCVCLKVSLTNFLLWIIPGSLKELSLEKRSACLSIYCIYLFFLASSSQCLQFSWQNFRNSLLFVFFLRLREGLIQSHPAGFVPKTGLKLTVP